ncbi:MAG TPA: acyl-CoA dehydrogenase family protein, partial [Myxococcota bacterium]|nr:acyl-CoA dehydrogenase family protein [Myxococcota bacterium]
ERATVALCAEMVGGMSAIFEATLAYLDERVQFGVKIGTFQALRHRAARLYIELELAQTAVEAAAAANGTDGFSLPKSRCSETYELIAAEGIQMHGGIGMTDEHIAGFFYKRSRVAAQSLGTAASHRDRWARLSGY